MTTVQRVAQIFGIVFILVAIVGFLSPEGRSMAVMNSGGIFGLFPVNLAHNVVHLLFGLWGLAAARSWAGAKQYATIGGAIYILLAILGLISSTNTLFGLAPLGGNDVWLHALLGIVLVYFGATAKGDATATAAA